MNTAVSASVFLIGGRLYYWEIVYEVHGSLVWMPNVVSGYSYKEIKGSPWRCASLWRGSDSASSGLNCLNVLNAKLEASHTWEISLARSASSSSLKLAVQVRWPINYAKLQGNAKFHAMGVCFSACSSLAVVNCRLLNWATKNPEGK